MTEAVMTAVFATALMGFFDLQLKSGIDLHGAADRCSSDSFWRARPW